MFFCSARLSHLPATGFPSRPVEINCRYEEKLNNYEHIISIGARRFCLRYISALSFQPGDSLHFQGEITAFSSQNRSGLFNYNRYLQQKGLQARLEPTDSIRISGHSPLPYYRLARLRKILLQKIDRTQPDTLTAALLKALCLGDKNELPSGIRQLFAETGVMHLLAVSGLHMGAVWLLLTFTCRALGFSGKKKQLLLLPFLWIYAGLTGFSPSVIRAVQLLTFLTFGNAFAKDYSPFNSVAASALFTLILKPFALYSIGMQMSYAAYTGILLLYPLFRNAFRKLKNPLPQLLSPLGATLAAQTATLPLSAYYFHSVSLNSFLINLIAIPLTTLLLYSGLIFLLLPGSVSHFLAYPLQLLATSLTELLRMFTSINWQANRLYPTPLHLLFLYTFLSSALFYILQRRKRRLIFLFLSGSVLCFYSCLHYSFLHRQNELIIFHAYPNSGILLQTNGDACWLKNTLSENQQNHFQPYLEQRKLRLLSPQPAFIHPHLQYQGKQLYTFRDTFSILDSPELTGSSGIWIITNGIKPPSVYPPLHLRPHLVVLDASNPAFSIALWESFCRHHHIPFRTTRKEGNIHLPVLLQKTQSKMPKSTVFNITLSFESGDNQTDHS